MGNEQSSVKQISNNVEAIWSKDPDDCPFEPLEGQVSAVVGNKIYLFGGVSQDMVESNSIYIYNVEKKQWSCVDQPKEGGDKIWPTARSGASMAALDGQLYVFGGLSQTTGWLDDLFVYNTENGVWSVPERGTCWPSPRDKAAMCAVGSKLYLFGGFCPQIDNKSVPEPCEVAPEAIGEDNDEDYEDVDEDVRNTQNAMTFQWSNQLYCYHNGKFCLMSNKADEAPTPRAAHAMTCATSSDGVSVLYILGGRDSEARQKDLWRYMIDSEKWEIVYCEGQHPVPASYHSMVAIGDHGERLVVYGGRGKTDEHSNQLHLLETSTSTWLQPSIGGSVKPPGMGMQRMSVYDGAVIMIGGVSGFQQGVGSLFHKSVYQLSVKSLLEGGVVKEEQQVTTNGVEK